MVEFFRYMHYRLYSWDKKNWEKTSWGKINDSADNAMLGVSFMLFINSLSIVFLFMLMVGLDTSPILHMPVIVFVLHGVIIMLICYYIFNYKKKYLTVYRRYSHEGKVIRRRKLAFIWLYIIFSFIFFIGLARIDREIK